MADISKAELKKEIAAILEGADLTTTTAKKIRQQVEEKLDVNLSSRKKEIDEIVMQCLEDKQNDKKSKGSAKKNGKAKPADDDDEDEEEASEPEASEEDEEASEEEAKPVKKRGAPAKKAPPKRKKADSDDEEADGASDDEDEKDDDYSPAAKKKATPKKKKAAGAKGKGKKGAKGKKGGSDSDSDEDWGKKKKKAGGAKKKTGFGKDCNLSAELASLVGAEVMPRHEVVKRIWAYIKEKNLYDPTNKQFCVCDAELGKIMGVKKFRTFGMMKYLKSHFLN